jgi:hypothetical protein
MNDVFGKMCKKNAVAYFKYFPYIYLAGRMETTKTTTG